MAKSFILIAFIIALSLLGVYAENSFLRTSKAISSAISTKTSKKSNIFDEFLTSVRSITHGQSIESSIKSITIAGLDGFNLKMNFPIEYSDFIFGFKTSFTSIDSLFVKKSFFIGDSDKLSLDTEYITSSNTVEARGKYENEYHGLKLHINGDSKENFRDVFISKTFKTPSRIRITLKSSYDFVMKNLHLGSRAEKNDVAAEVAFNTKDQQTSLTLVKSLDGVHEVSPTVILNTGKLSMKYSRKYLGGVLKADFYPGENVLIEWKDKGINGVWTSKANIPVKDTSKTKVSIAREWTY